MSGGKTLQLISEIPPETLLFVDSLASKENPVVKPSVAEQTLSPTDDPFVFGLNRV